MKFLFEHFIDSNFNRIEGKKLQFPIQVLLDLMEQFEAYYVYEQGLNTYFSEEEIEEGYAYYCYMAQQDLLNWDNFPPILANTVDSEFDE